MFAVEINIYLSPHLSISPSISPRPCLCDRVQMNWGNQGDDFPYPIPVKLLDNAQITMPILWGQDDVIHGVIMFSDVTNM